MLSKFKAPLTMDSPSILLLALKIKVFVMAKSLLDDVEFIVGSPLTVLRNANVMIHI